MANFLKLNKSYLGPEVLSNGSFEEYGPEIVQNPNFESSTGFTLGTGWSIDNNIATHEGSVGNLGLNASYTDGKTYLIKFTIDSIDSGVCNVYDSGTAYTYQSFNSAGTYTVSIEKVGTSALALRSDSVNCKISSVSLKESGVVELVDNGLFAGIANGTAVTSVSSQWTFSSLNSSNIESNILECISNASNQFAYFQATVDVGAEYRFKVDSVTGDLAANSIRIGVYGVVDVTGGSAEMVFTATSATLAIQFYAGDGLGAAQTNYAGISLQATNQFAYGYERFGVDNLGGQNSVFNLQDKTVRFIAKTANPNLIAVSGDTTTTSQEYLIKIDVESIVGTSDFLWFNGSGYYRIKLKLGENEFRYTRQGTNNAIFFGIDVNSAADIGSSFTLNSVSLQEVVNQPKLIGVDNVSMVSAPTDNTVVINNGLTDGADTLTITYAGASASSRVQMRNFFQDSIIRLANGNNTAEVLEITPPVLITDIVAS